MTQEINQLERAKLALKQDPPLRAQVYLCNWVSKTGGSFDPTHEYRVHPDDEAKLDAIIWKGADKFVVKAYLSQSGVICFAFSKDNVNPGWKLIATRALPVEMPKDTEVIGGDTLIQPEAPRLSHEMLETEEVQLVADLKEFALQLGERASPYCFYRTQLDLLIERINPKPVRNSADLPVDTLCEVWSVDRGTSWLRLTHKDGFSPFSSAINDSMPENHNEFKVLEQPNPTFWQGGECPVPDWVEVKVWYRDNREPTILDVNSKYEWGHENNDGDIIAYQIMGEKDA